MNFTRSLQAGALLAFAWALAPWAAAQLDQEALQVGIKESPPFAMKSETGEWSGVSADLWREIARRQGLEFEWSEVSLEGLVEQVEAGPLDAGIAALSMTSEREQRVDFSHPYYSTGLGIAVPEGAGGLNWYAVLMSVFSWQFISALFALAVVLLGAAFALWLFERHKNAEQFGGPTVKGLGSAFWWSAVTMTTVGYGDKAPVTAGGRLVGLVWMFTSIVIISGFTASIATSLTVNSMGSRIEGEDDLPGNRVATVPGSTSESYLREQGVRRASFQDVEAALAALEKGSVDAVVYDYAPLQYAARHAQGIEVLDAVFDRQSYAVALQRDSALRERINTTILELKEEGWIADLLGRYEIN